MTSLQEVYDRTAEHFFQMGERSGEVRMRRTGGGYFQCQYRGPEGRKCAVGLWIPDDRYNPSSESLGVTDGLEFDPRVTAMLPDDMRSSEMLYLLEALQEAHDIENNWSSTEAMRDRLAVIAGDHSLDASKLSNLKFKDR